MTIKTVKIVTPVVTSAALKFNFIFGADPEIFVKTKDGKNISAHELVPGTKKNPFKVENGAVQIDGTALEFNINPASTAKEFVGNIHSVMRQLSSMVKSKDATLDFDISPTVIYDKELFAKLPEHAVELGCEPDFNAYTGLENDRPDSSLLKGLETMRTASGHVHIGWTNDADRYAPDHFEDCRMLTNLLDWCLATASKGWDKDSQRSRLYGKPGAFRPKPYGMEYRVLSNRWLSDPKIAEFVFETARKAATFLKVYGPEPLLKLFGTGYKTKNISVPPTLHATSTQHYDYYFADLFGNRPGVTTKPRTDYSIRNRLRDGGRAFQEAIVA